MSVLGSTMIKEMIRGGSLLVDPFDNDIVRENGLDLRLGQEYCRMRRTSKVLDPRDPGDPSVYYECGKMKDGSLVIGPYEHVLVHTLEYIRLPGDIAGLVNLRSTWARTGLYIPPTVVDAGFEGQLTIELIGSSFPVRLYAGDRFLHLILVRVEGGVDRPYNGDYQGQTGVRLPKFFGGR